MGEKKEDYVFLLPPLSLDFYFWRSVCARVCLCVRARVCVCSCVHAFVCDRVVVCVCVCVSKCASVCVVLPLHVVLH